MQSAFVQLFLLRWRSFWREPYAVFWAVMLPLFFSAPVALAHRRVDLSAILAISGAFGSMWGVGWVVLQMRLCGSLRQFAVTPMPKAAFFGAFVLHRMCIAMIEAAIFVSVVGLLASKMSHVSFWGVLGVAGLGSIVHSSLALLVTSRASNVETALALMNFVLWPLVLGSGAIMPAPASVERVVSYTPVGAHLALFRFAIDGTAIDASPLVVVLAWSVVSLAAAKFIFRWTPA